MLVFAAFTPHPLLAIPEIGKEHISKIRRTMRSLRELSDDLYAAQPEVIILVSPHGSSTSDAFGINQQPDLAVDFTKYGNLSGRLIFRNDLAMGYRIKESVETRISVILTDDVELDYGSAIPLYRLTQRLKKNTFGVVPVASSFLSMREHYFFGQQINRQINRTTKRVAVISSGDLSHGASRSAMTAYNTKAFAFNKKVHTALGAQDTQTILGISDTELLGMNECGVRPLAMILGILDSRRYRASILSYEAALGIGYLTAAFHFA